MRGSRPAVCAAGTVALLALGATVFGQEIAPLDIYTGDPSLRRQPAATVFPAYPEEARLYRWEGEATVCFKINAEGEIVRPKIASSTHRVFERPALRAIRASAFTPLGAGEADSAAEVCRVFRFRLNAVDSPDAIPP
jgi:TonB family protein